MRRKHQRRVLINLLVIAVLALFLWVHEGCHLPTLEMELHRAERRMLTENSQVIWTHEHMSFYESSSMVVGVSPNFVHTYVENDPIPTLWPRAVTEPTLVILPEDMAYPSTEALYDREYAPALLAVDPPTGAESATLTIDFFQHIADTESFSYRYGNTKHFQYELRREYEEAEDLEPYVIQGQKQGEVFFFQVDAWYDYTLPEDASWEMLDLQGLENGALSLVTHMVFPEDMACYPYTLEFFDGSGALLGTYTNPAGEEGTE